MVCSGIVFMMLSIKIENFSFVNCPPGPLCEAALQSLAHSSVDSLYIDILALGFLFFEDLSESQSYKRSNMVHATAGVELIQG